LSPKNELAPISLLCFLLDRSLARVSEREHNDAGLRFH
jgi:hypothetical protein